MPSYRYSSFIKSNISAKKTNIRMLKLKRKKMWHLKVTILPIIVEALWMVNTRSLTRSQFTRDFKKFHSVEMLIYPEENYQHKENLNTVYVEYHLTSECNYLLPCKRFYLMENKENSMPSLHKLALKIFCKWCYLLWGYLT